MNNLVFITEARFIRGADGFVYGDVSFNYSLWERYLNSFDKIFVFARVKFDKHHISQKDTISNGKNVEFIELPYYVGPLAFLKKYLSLKKIIKEEINNHIYDRFICRVPGNISNLVINELRRIGKKYAVEVVGDPDDVFAPGAIKHLLRAYFRKKSVKSLKSNVINSSACLYVTESTLQSKYPPAEGVFNVCASNVKLEERYLSKSRAHWTHKQNYKLVSIGSLDQMYKGPDVLINAIEILNKKNDIGFYLKWLGGGKYLNELKVLCKNLNVSDLIEFKGNVNKSSVYDILKQADLFVLASRTEGLPRAVIEAMSLGLPIVATNVGGIPELLDSNVLVVKDSAEKLAEKILCIITDDNFYNSQAKRNFLKSKLYSEQILNKRRKNFYCYVIKNL